MIQFDANFSWASQPKVVGRAHLGDQITATVSTAGIRTVVSGYYDVPFLPDVDFTITMDEPLALTTPSGQDRAMTATTSVNVDGTGGVLLNSLIIGLLSPILGVVAFFYGEHVIGGAGSGDHGIGTALAKQWPAFELIHPVFETAKEYTAKIRFDWDRLTVDFLRSAHHRPLVVRERYPAARINGPDWLHKFALLSGRGALPPGHHRSGDERFTEANSVGRRHTGDGHTSAGDEDVRQGRCLPHHGERHRRGRLLRFRLYPRHCHRITVEVRGGP